MGGGWGGMGRDGEGWGGMGGWAYLLCFLKLFLDPQQLMLQHTHTHTSTLCQPNLTRLTVVCASSSFIASDSVAEEFCQRMTLIQLHLHTIYLLLTAHLVAVRFLLAEKTPHLTTRWKRESLDTHISSTQIIHKDTHTHTSSLRESLEISVLSLSLSLRADEA